jgi:hypothetical protein
MRIGAERARLRTQRAANKADTVTMRRGARETPPVQPKLPHCDTFNETWLSLRTLAKKGKQVFDVLSSPRVDDQVYAARMVDGCYQCPYCVGSLKNHLHYCACCKCPKWRLFGAGSDLETKNRHEAHVCPRLPPAF